MAFFMDKTTVFACFLGAAPMKKALKMVNCTTFYKK